jgi:hypothetical protein
MMRLELSLDGAWEARLDPEDIGTAERWQRPGVPFDRTLPVPAAWQAADPDLRRYVGVAWYRQRFRVPPEWGPGKVFVRFGAVDYSARAWLNGHELGSHAGGYTPFEFDAGAVIASGENVLTLRVEDGPRILDRPHGKQGGIWYTPTSGPWQPVKLLWRPREHIIGLRCFPDALHERVLVSGSCAIDGDALVRLEVQDAQGAVTGRAEVSLSAHAPSFSSEIVLSGARLWEIHDPHLYTVGATLVASSGEDLLTARFGLRTVEARDGAIWLNGHRQEIRGALDQAFWADSLYAIPSREAAECELRRAKELGFNLVRKHLKPEDPRSLDLADEIGMLIWAESANVERFSPESSAAVRRDLLAMIERDANHPSIVVWGCYNEDWGIENLWSEPERQAWLSALVGEIRSIDPTRLVCDNSGWAHVATDINDYHEYFSLPDRAAAFEARLDEIVRDPDDNFAAGYRSAGEPVLVSEFGAWMVGDPETIRRRSGSTDPAWFDHAGGYQHPEGTATTDASSTLAGVATIRGFEGRLAAAGLNRVFASPHAIVQQAQMRGARSAAAQVEGLRRRPRIAGYVVTELTDTEWEANGWLDHWREPKAGHTRLVAANGPVAVLAQPAGRAFVGGEELVLDIALVNDTPATLSGTLILTVDGREARIPDEQIVAAYSRTDGIAVSLPIPFGLSGPLDAHVRWEATAATLAETVVELARIAPDDLHRAPVRATAPMLPRILRQRLERHGYRMPRDWDPAATLAIVDRLDDSVLEFARGGGQVLYLAEEVLETPDPLGLRFFGLAADESWEMHTGFAWAADATLAPAPIRPDLGWECASFFPGRTIAADSLLSGDVQLAGWFEGWGAFAGAFAVGREIGAGRVLATTFRLERTFGVDLVATVLLDRFVDLLAAPFDVLPPGTGWPALSDQP